MRARVPPTAGIDTTHQWRALAAWVTDTECGAGPLLARVIVNRDGQRGGTTPPQEGRPSIFATDNDAPHAGERHDVTTGRP
jgi:hypothetical protein